MRHPRLHLLVALALLLVAAALAGCGVGAGESGTEARVLVTRDFGARQVDARIAQDLEARDDIVAVTPPVVSPDGAISVFEAEPAFGPSDERTERLVREVRASLPEGGELTGTTAMFSDISNLLNERMWLVIGFVVAVSMLLLAMVFRSVLVPLKAALMNLLSIGAAYGVLVAVFQWGWGSSLIGLEGPTPITSIIIVIMFPILFGLSMDYEVFLLSRVREEFVKTGDSVESVARGLAGTGRVITSAALIMIVVFLSFVASPVPSLKMLGLGLATAILVDATIVRMVLVPATMALLGKANWWLPAWLDRILPHLAVEAPSEASVVPAPRPRPERADVPVH